MTDTQKELLSLLIKFDGVCKKLDIKYYIVGGTLLGAIRHKGFIPWEDDVDVAMMVEDYQRLISSVDIKEEFYLRTEKNDPCYPFLFAKLYNLDFSNRSDLFVPYIDVFPLLPSRKPSTIILKMFDVISAINYALQIKMEWCQFVPYKKTIHRGLFSVLMFLSIAQLRGLRCFIVKLISTHKNTQYCFSPAGAYKSDKEFYRMDLFSESVCLAFENHVFSAPRGWDEYLRHMYNDYLVLPRESQRYPKHTVNE